MRRALLIAVVLTTPACDLLLDPSSHTGHMRDAAVGTTDAGRDAGGPPIDVGPHDGGPDAWAPPECTTSNDCGPAGMSGIVQCVSSRCVFCATPAAAMAHEVRHAASLRPYASIGVRSVPTGPALVLIGTTTTSATLPPLAHSAPIDAPANVMDVPVLAAVSSSCMGMTFTTASDLQFRPDPLTGSTSTTVGVIAENATTSVLTQVDWTDTGSSMGSAGAMCNTQTLPAAYDATSAFMRSPGMDMVPHEYQMVRSADGTGGYAYLGFDTPGANRSQFYNGFQAPMTDYALLTSAGPFMVLGNDTMDRIIWWDPQAGTGPEYLMTPGRTGDPSVALKMGSVPMMAGELLHFTAAYPVGNVVRLVDTDCTSYCNPVGQAVDVSTSAMTVTATRFALAGATPVLLTSEHLADGSEQVALRVLRANDMPFDAPGGGHALVLDTVPSGATISDIQLAIVTGTVTRYAVVWVVSQGGMVSVRLQTFAASC